MTPIKKFKNNRSFAFYMSVSILSIVIIVFSFMIAYNYYVSRNLLLKNVKEITRNLTSSAINKSEGFFLGIEKIGINSALFISKDDYFLENTESIISDILIVNDDVFGSCIAYKPIISNSDTILNAPYGWKTDSGLQFKNLGDKDYNYLLWDWYTIPFNESRNIWSEPYYDDGGGNTLMTTFSVPSYSTLGDKSSFVGVLTIDVSLKWLNEMISNIKFFESGFAFLISKEGNIISHPDTSLIMKKDIIQLAKDSNDAQFEQFAYKMLDGQEGFEVLDKGFLDEKSLVYYSPLKNNSWSLCFVFPESELYEDLTVLHNRLIIILTSGILILFVLIIFLSGRMTKPIRKLASIMGEDSETFIATQIPEIGGSSEIESLSKSFQLLRNELKKYISNLKDVTATKERIESEINIARKLQLSMLPNSQLLGFSDKINIASFTKPAKEVGGDFYDYFFLDDKHLFIAIGDVSGKGMGAALFMSSTITLLRAYAKTSGNDLCKTIGLTSEYLCNNNSQKYFVTIFVSILNIETNEMKYINAGHNYPIIISENSDIQTLNKTHMPPLGIIKSKKIIHSNLVLKNNDKFFLYTDGLTESMNSKEELFTSKALLNILTKNAKSNPENLIDIVNDNLIKFTQTASQYDDITMLCINSTNKSVESIFQIVFEDVEELIILDELRYKMEEFFKDQDTSSKTISRLVLIFEELITNALKYGSSEQVLTQIEIRISVMSDHLEVMISDTGKSFDIVDEINQSDDKLVNSQIIGKRGLVLVGKMTDDIHYSRDDGKNIIRFKVENH